MRIFYLNNRGILDKKDLLAVVSILNKNGTVVFPTDTSYGLGARADRDKALEKVFIIKGRRKTKTVSIAVGSRTQADHYGKISKVFVKLWKCFMPGSLTLVIPSKIEKKRYLVRDDGTVAIRHIPTPVVRQLLKKLSVPISCTSAGRSGMGEIYSLKDYLKNYGARKKADAFIDMGRLKRIRPSTVLSLKDDLVILRKGSITSKQISLCLKN